jgi:hypothetical protein
LNKPQYSQARAEKTALFYFQASERSNPASSGDCFRASAEKTLFKRASEMIPRIARIISERAQKKLFI